MPWLDAVHGNAGMQPGWSVPTPERRRIVNTLCHVNLARGYRGGERQTELLVRSLARAGCRQRLVVRRGQPLADRLADVPGLDVRGIGKPFAIHAGHLRGCHVHVHEAKAAHLAHWADRLFGAPYVITRRVDNRPGGSPITRAIYRRAAGVVALSSAIARVLTDYDARLDPRVIPSAAAGLSATPATASALREAWGGDFVVGQVGALDDSQKGQRVLIAAAHELLAESPGWRFVLVGDGRDAAALRELAAGRPEIVFTGHVDNVGDYLAAFDAFAYPSWHEGLGSALIDAMGFGLPIIASNVDGIPELVGDDGEGALIEPGDAQALARVLAQCREDAALRERWGQAGRARAAEFSAARMAQRYLAWYRTLDWDVGPVRSR